MLAPKSHDQNGFNLVFQPSCETTLGKNEDTFKGRLELIVTLDLNDSWPPLTFKSSIVSFLTRFKFIPFLI